MRISRVKRLKSLLRLRNMSKLGILRVPQVSARGVKRFFRLKNLFCAARSFTRFWQAGVNPFVLVIAHISKTQRISRP